MITLAKTKHVVAFVFAVCSSLGSVNAANLITNGDFTAGVADGNFNNTGGYGGIPDWNFVGTTGHNSDGSTAYYGDGVNGAGVNIDYFSPVNSTIDNMGNSIGDFAFLQIQASDSGALLYQSFNVVAGTTYALTFDAAGRGNYYDGNQLMAEVTDGTTPNTGNILFEQTSGPLPGDKFYTNTTTGTSPNFTTVMGTGLTFTADTTGLATLAFTVNDLTGAPDVTIDFTNVDVSVAPEPSTYAMMLAAGGILVLCGRRRLMCV